MDRMAFEVSFSFLPGFSLPRLPLARPGQALKVSRADIAAHEQEASPRGDDKSGDE